MSRTVGITSSMNSRSERVASSCVISPYGKAVIQIIDIPLAHVFFEVLPSPRVWRADHKAAALLCTGGGFKGLFAEGHSARSATLRAALAPYQWTDTLRLSAFAGAMPDGRAASIVSALPHRACGYWRFRPGHVRVKSTRVIALLGGYLSVNFADRFGIRIGSRKFRPRRAAYSRLPGYHNGG